MFADKAVAHVATVNAFANKFGTYTGAIRNEATREVIRERFETFDEARNFVRTKAWELFGEVSFAPMKRKGEYFANCWKAV
jgi:hypothetical protein